jgi:hypothetical protein
MSGKPKTHRDVRKQLGILVKRPIQAHDEPYTFTRNIFKMLESVTGKDRLMASSDEWGRVINMTQNTTMGVSTFHKYVITVGKKYKWDNETKTCLAFFLAYGADPKIAVAPAKTKDPKKKAHMKNLEGQNAIQITDKDQQELRDIMKMWVSEEDSVKRAGILRNLTNGLKDYLVKSSVAYVSKISEKYANPDGDRTAHELLPHKVIEEEVNAYNDWRKLESCGLATKLDIVSKLGREDMYNRNLIHRELLRELLNTQMVKWIHENISKTELIESILGSWNDSKTREKMELKLRENLELPKSWNEDYVLNDMNGRKSSLLSVPGCIWSIKEFIDRKPHQERGSYIGWGHGTKHMTALELALHKNKENTARVLLKYHASTSRVDKEKTRRRAVELFESIKNGEKQKEKEKKYSKTVDDQQSDGDTKKNTSKEEEDDGIVVVDARSPDPVVTTKNRKDNRVVREEKQSNNDVSDKDIPIVPEIDEKLQNNLQESKPEWNERFKPKPPPGMCARTVEENCVVS